MIINTVNNEKEVAELENTKMDKVNPTFEGNLTRNPNQVYTNTVDLRTSCDYIDVRQYTEEIADLRDFIANILTPYDTNGVLKIYSGGNELVNIGSNYSTTTTKLAIGDSITSSAQKIFSNNLEGILEQMDDKEIQYNITAGKAYYKFDLDYYRNNSTSTYIYTSSGYTYLRIRLILKQATFTSDDTAMDSGIVKKKPDFVLNDITDSFLHGRNHLCSGDNNIIFGINNFGQGNQMVIGHYNDSINSLAGVSSGTSNGSAFCIGNGTSSGGANAFRVTYAGVIHAKSSTVGTGADYSEYFEWEDGNEDNEDRVGYFVTFDDKQKIRKANATDDYILGIVSGLPCIIGNGDECWRGRYILDEFGRFIEETFEYEETVDGETVTKIGTKYKENPEYNPNQEYVERAKRKEWSAIGMIGVLSVYDDGTCQENGYCTVSDGGIATACKYGANAYRVLERVNDNIVKVLFK